MFITTIIFIVVLSVIVFVHEMGHFYTARKLGAKVEEFGLGLPPRIFGVKKIAGKLKIIFGKEKEEVENAPTIYSLNWIPIGGFVKIKGEGGVEGGVESEDSFANKPVWKRSVMIVSGVVMNVVFCMFLLMIGFGIGMPAVLDDDMDKAIISSRNLQVLKVMPEGNAKKADVRVGDIISIVDGQRFLQVTDLNQYINGRVDQEVGVIVTRRGEEIHKTISVGTYIINGEEFTGLGVGLIETAMVRYPWYLAIWKGIVATFVWLITIVLAFAMVFKNLIVGAPVGVEVAGPVGIAVLTGQAAKMGFVYLLQFTALLSLNLAIINILPFPALDGGRLLFLAIEKIRGRAVKQEWENLVHNVGFILLMGLVVIVTLGDVLRYGGGLWGAIRGFVGV